VRTGFQDSLVHNFDLVVPDVALVAFRLLIFSAYVCHTDGIFNYTVSHFSIFLALISTIQTSISDLDFNRVAFNGSDIYHTDQYP